MAVMREIEMDRAGVCRQIHIKSLGFKLQMQALVHLVSKFGSPDLFHIHEMFN
jgi:hypothetical protein